MARLVLDDLCKAYGGPNRQTIQAVCNLSLAVEDGELLALVGPSGCGKTTTLRLLAGLEESDRGTIALDGQRLNKVPPKDRDIAMVFQHSALYPHMTGFENMAFALTLRKVPKPEVEKRVREAATLLDLELCLDRLPKALSGGERQRIAVGRAIVRRPKLFLFDEPLSNLDAPSRAHMRREISRLQRQLRVTTIHVTHDQAEAMALGDRVAVMNEGVIQQVGTPSEIYHQPVNLFVATFIGSPPTNLLRGVLVPAGDTLRFTSKPDGGRPGSLSVAIDRSMVQKLIDYVEKQVVLGLRPEDIIRGAASASDSAVQAEVRFVERFGFDTHVHLAAGTDTFVARWQGDSTSIAERERLVVLFDMRKALFFDPNNGAAIP